MFVMASVPSPTPALRDGTATTPAGGPAPDRTADDTARRLVAAAADVFAEKGYDGAGVAEIARRAGLTTGAIYSRFSGKAELLAAAVQDSAPEQFRALFAESVQAGRATDILQMVGEHLVSGPPTGRTDLLLEAVVAARRDPEVAAGVRDALAARKARWAELIDASKAVGAISGDVDTDALVHFVHAVGLGFLAYEAVGIEHPPLELWQTLIAKLVASLTNPTGVPDEQ
jgi:TetR/AcrR family transcriptional regulator, repressor for uid operon